MTTIKTVLFPVYSFPPLNAGGTFRLVKFTKFLPEFGWRPLVVAPEWTEENSNGMYDPSMASMIQCEVIRIPYIQIQDNLSTSIRNRMRCWLSDEPHFSTLFSNMLNACRMIMKQRQVQAVFASSHYRFLHRIACQLHCEFGTPWIADHRDIADQEWTNTHHSFKDWCRVKKEVYLDSLYTKNASAITTVSAPLAQRLRSRNIAPVYEIMNGFDPDDFPPKPVSRIPSKAFRIIYCGSFFGKRDPSVFLDGLDLLCASHPELSKRVEVWFYGKTSNAIAGPAHGRPCRELINVGGFISHKEALNKQQDAQVVYLISHPSKGIVTGKIFEYLNAGVPIISVPGDGDITDRIISETSTGVICRTKHEVCNQLESWVKHWLEFGHLPLRVNSSAIAAYTRRNQAGQLASLLDNIVAHSC